MIYAYSVFRFWASPGALRANIRFVPEASKSYNNDLSPGSCSESARLTPRIAINKKKRLNTKWVEKLMELITPPQLHGTRSKKPITTKPIYSVKISIRKADKFSPSVRNLPLIRQPTMISSEAGIAQDR